MIGVAGLCFVLLLVGCLLAFQRKLIYFPREYDWNEEAEFVGLGGEVIEYNSNGDAMKAYFLAGNGDGPEAPIYFTFNGNAGRALGWENFARGMQRADPSTSWLLVEYPGYGSCEGEPTRTSMMAAAGGAREALREKLGITSEELTARSRAIGHSMGAAAAAEFASTYGASEVVMISPFTSLYDMAKRAVSPALAFLVRDRWDNAARLDELSQRPSRPRVLIFHGGRDSVVPVKMGRKLAESHAGWVEYVEIPGGDHDDVINPVGEQYANDLKKRFENRN